MIENHIKDSAICQRGCISFLCVFLMAFSYGVHAQGESSVMTLVFPSGSRTLAMGEVGTALADDENVLFYNPAGLGMSNPRWRGGALTEFYEQLLPAFKIPDLWHLHLAGCYQPPITAVGGFGVDFNEINFGSNGYILGRARSYEYVLSSGWGFNLEGLGIKNHGFGISFKYFYSALAPGIGPGNQGAAQSMAIDFGYLWQILPFMRFGFTFADMGPSISYTSADQEDPIPFTINTAIAYKDDFCVKNIRVLELATELRSDLELVKNYPDKPPDPFWKAIYTGFLGDTSQTLNGKLHEISWHYGFDATFLNTLSFRQGFLIDANGQRYETSWGLGLRWCNHFEFDFCSIFSPEGYMKGLFGPDGSTGARNGQWGINFTFFRMFDWKMKDHSWWIK